MYRLYWIIASRFETDRKFLGRGGLRSPRSARVERAARRCAHTSRRPSGNDADDKNSTRYRVVVVFGDDGDDDVVVLASAREPRRPAFAAPPRKKSARPLKQLREESKTRVFVNNIECENSRDTAGRFIATVYHRLPAAAWITGSCPTTTTTTIIPRTTVSIQLSHRVLAAWRNNSRDTPTVLLYQRCWFRGEERGEAGKKTKASRQPSCRTRLSRRRWLLSA